MTYLYGHQKDSKADIVLSASDGNITVTCAETGDQRVIEANRLLRSRKYNQFERTVAYILQGIPANASVLFTDAGVGVINKIVYANYLRFPFA